MADSGRWATPAEAGLPIVPVLGRPSGWELDATGADGGVCRVGGAERTVDGGECLRLVAAGDTALLRYGELSLCAHVERRARALPPPGFLDPLLGAAAAFAVVAGLGGLAFVFAVTARSIVAKPSALQRPDELARAYYLEADWLSTHVVESDLRDNAERSWMDPGPATAPVAAALRGPSSNESSDELSPHAVGGTILSHFAAIESCAQPPSHSASPSTRTVRVELTVAPSGVVQAVRFLGTELGDDLVQCVGDQLRRFEFPATPAVTTTRLTIRLGS